MRVVLANIVAVLMVLAVPGASIGQTAPRAENAQRVERLVATLSQEAATLCPLTDPGDQDALNRCRSALFNDSYFKRSLAHRAVGPAESGTRGATEGNDPHSVRSGGAVRSLSASVHVQRPVPHGI